MHCTTSGLAIKNAIFETIHVHMAQTLDLSSLHQCCLSTKSRVISLLPLFKICNVLYSIMEACTDKRHGAFALIDVLCRERNMCNFCNSMPKLQCVSCNKNPGVSCATCKRDHVRCNLLQPKSLHSQAHGVKTFHGHDQNARTSLCPRRFGQGLKMDEKGAVEFGLQGVGYEPTNGTGFFRLHNAHGPWR